MTWWSGRQRESASAVPKPWQADQRSTTELQPLPIEEVQGQIEALKAEHRSIAIVAAESTPVRSHVAEIAKATGFVPVILKSARDVCRLAPTSAPIILETSDDVALLCQVVYRLYMSWMPGTPPGIIALLSYEVMERNPSVATWDINGGAALICLLSPEDAPSLRTVLKRVQDVTTER